MHNGTIQVFYLWDPIKLGYVTFYAAKMMHEGSLTGELGESVTIPEGRKWPGTYTIVEPGEIVTGGPLEYTADNVGDHKY